MGKCDQKYNNHESPIREKRELGRRVEVLRGPIRHKIKNVLHLVRLGKEVGDWCRGN